MAQDLLAPPVLSTPAEHLYEHSRPEELPAESRLPRRTDDELCEVYEVRRTAAELHAAKRRRVALQFPDSMLGDAPRVAGLLKERLASLDTAPEEEGRPGRGVARIYILADTSYSACCVDEIAAEHVDADVVVHYGRSCLSPTSRLPVLYVFTKHELDEGRAADAFGAEFPDKDARVVLMADVAFQDHVSPLFRRLRDRGYHGLLSTTVVHNPLGSIPNRSVVDAEERVLDISEASTPSLKDFAVFHVSTPPTSLLLALSSRVKSFHIHHTPALGALASPSAPSPPSTRGLLGRRYAKVLTLATAGVIGILVNTLSVANYLSSIDNIRRQIAAAGKKSYTVVVGKLNPAKLANFAEMDGWVVVGCWESSLVEDDAGFYRPVVTPFELEMALAGDETRIWGERWWGGIEAVRGEDESSGRGRQLQHEDSSAEGGEAPETATGGIEEDESVPPEFDLRTGRLVTHSRPMRVASSTPRQNGASAEGVTGHTKTLALRPKSELATVNGALSPGAEFLRSQRTWQGLGSDFDATERSAAVEEGRSGVARGYSVGEAAERR